ncbi:MAG: hypothetical protein P0Y65_05905 [Candidatus Devosia phytovorans]|uniref:Uncharacterized protein n=1 Tax=Candidatus Devosia phytovorans TaxID=3121372 RepID=A0AAJ5VVY4_9HYPH|nr:hypothetical protein [Devosia sp.]WEK05789.1 MAG: hypothetical protein P0Y65_05905 [Devosia sp.]
MRTIFRAAIAAAVLPVLWPVAAFAQAVYADPVILTEQTFTQQLLTAILPALGLVITAVLTWAANELRKRTGIDIEARHREALQSALVNAILYALQRARWVAGQPTDPLLNVARGYVEHSVPDALAKFGIDTATSTGKAMLDRLLTPHLPLPAGTVMPNGDKLVGRAN